VKDFSNKSMFALGRFVKRFSCRWWRRGRGRRECSSRHQLAKNSPKEILVHYAGSYHIPAVLHFAGHS